ncbi:MAG TPA: hypothetical protein VFF72_01905 [Caldimonas sp.]|nr:hypothetical protein [Caldimonas sp.]
MRHTALLAVSLALSLFAGEAAARAYDAKALARYDTSYQKCESRFTEMRGHRDEAYLNLWRIELTPKTQAQLAKLRASPTYRSEQQRLAGTPASKTTAAAAPVERECQGLWGELQRRKPKH